MGTRVLFSASIFALVSALSAHAADTVTFQEQVSTQGAVAFVGGVPFSWTGFYIGAQGGGFSSKTTLSGRDEGNGGALRPFTDEKFLPKPSGFFGGGYIGYSFGFGNGFVLGAETDAIFSGRKDTKVLDRDAYEGDNPEGRPRQGAVAEVAKYTIKQKWAGATRAYAGFSYDRIMPYVSGGVAYTELQHLATISQENAAGQELNSQTLFDQKKSMVGYTVGAGLNFAATDNLLIRAEYRYTDYGKKKLSAENQAEPHQNGQYNQRANNDYGESGYKTNDFRIGIAYKF